MDILRLVPWRHTKHNQDIMRNSRIGAPQTNSRFCEIASLANVKLNSVVLVIRDIVSEYSNMRPELIYFDDSTLELNKVMAGASFWVWFYCLGDSGPDDAHFFTDLELRLVGDIRPGFAVSFADRLELIERWNEGMRFGDWAILVAKRISEKLEIAEVNTPLGKKGRKVEKKKRG